MTRKYPYYPAKDGGKAGAGTEWFVAACGRRWKTKNLGIYSNRLMRNSKTAGKKPSDPGMEKWLSVHATGAAADIGYTDRKIGVAMWDWFLANAAALGIVEIHDYAYDANASDKKPGYGRGFRCSRGEGSKGVKIYDAKENAGSFGGKWIHIELEPEFAKDAAKMEAAWRALPKPGEVK
jgi:hypothetical protein